MVEMLSHGFFEKVSNMGATEVWEVGHHTSVVSDLGRHGAEAGRPHTTLPHLGIFFQWEQ